MKRVLVVSDVWPCNDLTAGLALSKLISSISKTSEVSTFAFIDRSLAKHKPITGSSVSNFYTFKPNENWTGGRPFRFIFEPFIKFCTLREVDRVAQELELVINEVHPDHVIIVLQGQTSYLLSRFILDQKVPFTTLTWDPWEWWSSTHSVGPNLDLLVQESHGFIYSAGTHLVPTLKFSQVNSIEESRSRVIYFPELETSLSSGSKMSSKRINIVFSGQNYASQEMSQFISALSRRNWNVNGKEIFLHIVGCSIPIRDKNVVQHGWIDNRNLPNFLSNFDIAFLPYPTMEKYLFVAQQSFPSKLSTYLSASLPVIYLGPQSASVLYVASDVIYELSNNGDDLLNLEEIINEIDDFYPELAKKANSLYRSMFSYEAFDQNIYSWGVSVGLNLKEEFQHKSANLKSAETTFKYMGGRFQETIFLRRIQLIFSKALITKVTSIFFRLLFALRARLRAYGFVILARIGKTVANIYVTIFRLRNYRK